MREELGVAFRCVFPGRAEEATLDRFIDLMESNGWHYGGGWTPEGMSGVVEFHVSTADEATRCRSELMAWLNRAAWVASITTCRLIDVNCFDGEV